MHLFPRVHDLVLPGVNITVHGHPDGGMSRNGLQDFHARCLACHIGQIAVAEYMSGSAVKIDGFFDSCPGVIVNGHGDRLSSADDESCFLQRMQYLQHKRIEGDIQGSALCFCGADDGLVASWMGHIALYMNRLFDGRFSGNFTRTVAFILFIIYHCPVSYPECQGFESTRSHQRENADPIRVSAFFVVRFSALFTPKGFFFSGFCSVFVPRPTSKA